MLEPFDHVGDYCLVLFIGRGGMGEVWLGVKRGTLRPVAVKFLHPDLAENEKCVENFHREAEIGMQLGGCGSIVAVHGPVAEELVGDPDCPDRLLYLVQDFVDGVTLRRFSDRFSKSMKKRLPIPLVVHIIRSMLRAADAAHSHGIGKKSLPVVHGDINPGNVLISSRGEIKVTDFGISRFAPEPTFISRPVGTLPYMAPDQYRGRICLQNDLYSIGAVLHELLTGEPPLPSGGSFRTMERKLLNSPVPPLGRNDVPAALDRLRRGLLEKNADLRIQNADEALQILATVDQTDCQDDLKATYVRMFGPPKSRLTKFLEGKGNGEGSFVVKLLKEKHRTGTSETPEGSEPEVASSLTKSLGPKDDADDDDNGGMLWFAKEEEEVPKTEVHHTLPVKRIGRTVRLDGPIGGLEAESASPSPTEPEASPRPRAVSADKSASRLPMSTGTSGRYPPRPPGLADGVPFQKHRRAQRWRGGGHLDGVPVEPWPPTPRRPRVQAATRVTSRTPSQSPRRAEGRIHPVILAVGVVLLALNLGMVVWMLINHQLAQASSPSPVHPAAQAESGAEP